MVFCDEFAFINQRLFLKVVTPLMLVARTSLICLSTFNTSTQDQFNELFDENDDQLNVSERNTRNRDRYKRFNYSFVCPNCMVKGIRHECSHMRFRIPPWQSEERTVLVDWMMRNAKVRPEPLLLRERLTPPGERRTETSRRAVSSTGRGTRCSRDSS